MSNRYRIGQSAFKDLTVGRARLPYKRVCVNAGEDVNGNPIEYRSVLDTNGNARAASYGADYDNAGGAELVVENPHGTQQIANDILDAIKNYAYQPFTSVDAFIPDAADLGDIVDILTSTSIIAEQTIEFDGLGASSTVSAPGEDETDNEFGEYISKTERDIMRANSSISALSTSFKVENGRISATISDMSDPTKKGSLANKIAEVEMTVDGITAKVAASQEKYVTTGLTIDYYGYGPPTEKAAGNNGRKYLDQSTGQVYQSDGNSWSKYGDPLQTVNYELNSRIDQTVDSISTAVSVSKQYTDNAVSGAEDYANTLYQNSQSTITQTANSLTTKIVSEYGLYDVSRLPAGAIINYGYGSQNSSAAPDPTTHNGEYYIDANSGRVWVSNGTSWVRYKPVDTDGTVHDALPTTTETLGAKLEVTDEYVRSQVKRLGDDLQTTQTIIEQMPDSIMAQVSGVNAEEWSQEGSDGNGYYYAGDVIKITTPATPISAASVRYYEALYNMPATAYYYPTSETGASYWSVTSAPSVQSAIKMGLRGITIDYEASTSPNSAYITLNKDGVEIGGGTIVMSNVQADTIAAGTYIQSPQIYGGVLYGGTPSAPNGRLQVGADAGGYGDLTLTNAGASYTVFQILDYQGSAGFSSYGRSIGTWDTTLGYGRFVAATGTVFDFSDATVILPSS